MFLQLDNDGITWINRIGLAEKNLLSVEVETTAGIRPVDVSHISYRR